MPCVGKWMLRTVCPGLFASISYSFIVHLSMSQERKNNSKGPIGKI